MHSRSVVEGFDVIEDRESGFFSNLKVQVVERLGLDRSEEALCDRVVSTLSWAAHAATHLVDIELVLILVAAVLRAPVRVMDEARLGSAS